VGSEARGIALVDVLDRRRGRVEAGIVHPALQRLEAHPVAAELLPLEARMVEVGEGACVEIPQVQDVHVVLDEQLPVALGNKVFVGDLGQKGGLEAADVLRQLAEPRVEGSRVRVGVGEDHAAPGAHRSGEQPPGGQVHAGELILQLGDPSQPAVEAEVPEVVGADNAGTGVAAPGEQPHAPVTAQIVEAAQLTVEPAHDDEGVEARLQGHEVARVGQFRLGCRQMPGAGEEEALLPLEPFFGPVGLGREQVARRGGDPRVHIRHRIKPVCRVRDRRVSVGGRSSCLCLASGVASGSGSGFASGSGSGFAAAAATAPARRGPRSTRRGGRPSR
jgi:hypothetical protein